MMHQNFEEYDEVYKKKENSNMKKKRKSLKELKVSKGFPITNGNQLSRRPGRACTLELALARFF